MKVLGKKHLKSLIFLFVVLILILNLTIQYSRSSFTALYLRDATVKPKILETQTSTPLPRIHNIPNFSELPVDRNAEKIFIKDVLKVALDSFKADAPEVRKWWWTFASTAKCDKLVKLGADRDSGKWFCNTTYGGLVYSIGSLNIFTFEKAFDKSKWKVYTFDCTMKYAATPPAGVTFYPWCIGQPQNLLGKVASYGETYNLSTVMHKLGHSRLDILKVDTEGAEFELFHELSTFEDSRLPTHIMVEIHVESSSGYNVRTIRDFIKYRNYKLISVEVNLWHNYVAELVFIRQT